MGSLHDLPPLHRPTQVRYGVLGFACSLSLITYLDRICISRASADIRTDLGFTTQQMGIVFSAFTFGYALFEIPAGWMGDRWGTRRVLTRIVVCWSLFTALTGCVWTFAAPVAVGPWSFVFDSLLLMLLIRFLFGLGEAGAYPNLTRVVGDWFPFRDRAFALGAIWASARIGGAIAPIVIGRLSVALGWRPAFYVLGLVGIAWAVVFWWWFRDRPRQHPACNDAEVDLIEKDADRGGGLHAAHRPAAGTHSEQIAAAPAQSEQIAVAPAAADRGLWRQLWSILLFLLTVGAMCSAAFWVCLGWYFYPTWQPEYLKDVFGYEYSDRTSELLTGLPFLCGAVGCLFGGGLSDWLVGRLGRRWGRSLVGLVGFTGAGLCVLATGYATAVWQAVTLLCLAFFINDLAIPVIWAACADVGGRYAGTLSGLMNTVGAVGAIVTPVLIPYVLGWLPEDYSAEMRWRVVFTGLAGAWFLGAVSWLFIDASRRLDN